MGEETKVEKMFVTLEDGRGIVWEGIKDVQFTECIEHDYYDDTVVVPSLTVTFEAKYPKFFRCKNRKRYKKLMMSLGLSRDYMDQYLKFADTLRRMDAKHLPTYQELWNANRVNFIGI